MISFGAKYINSVNIQKINRNNDLVEQCRVSCVELDPECDEDIDVMADIAERWDSYWKFPELIFNCMKYYSKYNDKLEGNKFYALTAQTKHFTCLQPSEVLAVCQLDEESDDTVKLKYLEVKPDNVGLVKKPYEYNHVGSGVLNALKDIFSGKRITLFSTPTAVEFYKANNFSKSGTTCSEMHYDA